MTAILKEVKSIVDAIRGNCCQSQIVGFEMNLATFDIMCMESQFTIAIHKNYVPSIFGLPTSINNRIAPRAINVIVKMGMCQKQLNKVRIICLIKTK